MDCISGKRHSCDSDDPQTSLDVKKTKCISVFGDDRPDYYPATTMPVSGWLQPCKICRSWTSRILRVKEEENLSVCARCQSKLKSIATAVGATQVSTSHRQEDRCHNDGFSDSRGTSLLKHDQTINTSARSAWGSLSSSLQLGVSNQGVDSILSSPLMPVLGNKKVVVASGAAGSTATSAEECFHHLDAPSLATAFSLSSTEGGSPLFTTDSSLFSSSQSE